MRYQNIDTISFTDYKGDKFAVKDIRPISIFTTILEIKILDNALLDEIISRKDLFGDGAEDLSYALFDHNIEKITESKFDLSKLKKLKIPTFEEAL